jgi:hypothetical protein
MEIAHLRNESKKEESPTSAYPNFSPSDIPFDILQYASKTNIIPVYKYGKVTGLTVGILDSFEAIVTPVETCRNKDIHVVSVSWLKSVFPQMAFSRPGDSGSLYFIDWRALSVHKNSILPLAIHVEGSGHGSVGTRIDKALRPGFNFCGSSCGQDSAQDIKFNKLLYYVTLRRKRS